MKKNIIILVWVLFTSCGPGEEAKNIKLILPPDGIAPTVLTILPKNNSENVPLNSRVVIVFNESMDPTTLNLDAVQITDDQTGQVVRGTFHLSEKALTFKPEQLLNPNSTYYIYISTKTRDLSGTPLELPAEAVFSTGSEIDTIAPEVRIFFPSSDSERVSVNILVAISFSEPINPALINDQTFFIDDTQSGERVSGRINVLDSHIVFMPAGFFLKPETVHQVSITTAIEDLAGNKITPPIIWRFKTRKSLFK